MICSKSGWLCFFLLEFRPWHTQLQCEFFLFDIFINEHFRNLKLSVIIAIYCIPSRYIDTAIYLSIGACCECRSAIKFECEFRVSFKLFLQEHLCFPSINAIFVTRSHACSSDSNFQQYPLHAILGHCSDLIALALPHADWTLYSTGLSTSTCIGSQLLLYLTLSYPWSLSRKYELEGQCAMGKVHSSW